MKINLYILIVFLLLVVCCSKKNQINKSLASDTSKEQKFQSDELREMGVRGNVVYVIDTLWYAKEKFGELVKDVISRIKRYDFNDKNQLVCEAYYNSDCQLDEKIIHKYNEEDKISSIKSYQANGDLKYSYEYIYVNEHTYIETYYGDYSYKKTIYHTDMKIDSSYCIKKEKGKEIISKCICEKIDNNTEKYYKYDSDKGNENQIIFYDDNRNMIKFVVNDELSFERTYLDKIMIKSVYYNSESTFTYKLDSLKYDDNGSLIGYMVYRHHDNDYINKNFLNNELMNRYIRYR